MKTTRQRINNALWYQVGGYGGVINGPDDIKETHLIKECLGVDSLDSIEIMMSLESEFVISLDDEIAEEWKTVGDIYRYIESKEY